MKIITYASRVAVLDKRTCQFCNRADGLTFIEGSRKFDEFKPPNGCLNEICRCLYVYSRLEKPEEPFETPEKKLPIIKKTQAKHYYESKCPKCNASIKSNIDLCGNCKAKIVWKEGRPNVTTEVSLNQHGNLVSFLFLLIILLLVIIFSFFLN